MIASIKQKLENRPGIYMIVFHWPLARIVRGLFAIALFYFAFANGDMLAAFAGAYFGFQAVLNTGCGLRPNGGCQV